MIASKAGTFADGRRIGRDFSPAAIVASAERSLRNLGLDVLPLLQLHGPAVAELTDDLRAALADLKARGLVRALGVNSFDPAVIGHAIGLPDFDVVMVDYNVLRPEREPLIARAAAAGKGVLAGMPLAMGHTGAAGRRSSARRATSGTPPAACCGTAARCATARASASCNRLPGMTGAQAALAYVLANPNVASAVIGTTRMAHLTRKPRRLRPGLCRRRPLAAHPRPASLTRAFRDDSRRGRSHGAEQR